jgi:thymidylate synthase
MRIPVIFPSFKKEDGGVCVDGVELAAEAPAPPDVVVLAEAYATTPEMAARVAASTVRPPLPSARHALYAVGPSRDDARGFRYRLLTYSHAATTPDRTEEPYLELACRVLLDGRERPDRTGVGTIGLFGAQMRFDIAETVPLLTTKRVPWKTCIEELLWFLRGDTDAKVLQKKGIKIWDGNTSREFLDGRGLTHYDVGVLGPGYGWAMRHFGGTYDPVYADTGNLTPDAAAALANCGGVDQIAYVLDQLRRDPFSRRILMSYWNPRDFDKIALLPCHFACQFYVEPGPEASAPLQLSCHLNMRSNDVFLGNPTNIFSYAVLTYILAAKTGMQPKELVWTGGDVHLYKNHLDQIREQLKRPMRPLPKLILSDAVKDKDFADMTIADFELVGYYPHPTIAAPMAV